MIARISYSAADVVIIDTQLCPFKAAVSLSGAPRELQETHNGAETKSSAWVKLFPPIHSAKTSCWSPTSATRGRSFRLPKFVWKKAEVLPELRHLKWLLDENTGCVG